MVVDTALDMVVDTALDMGMGKISIITTVFNREKYLRAAIESILAQTYADFELILFDDGSSDRSVEIASEYAARNGRIKAIASPHIGRIPALMAASNLASGQYMAVLDSDDYISPNCLEATASIMEARADVGMVYSDCIYVNSDGKELRPRAQSRIPYSFDRFLVDFIPFNFRIYRSSLFELVGGYDPEQLHGEDYDLALKLAEKTEVKFCPEATYYYRQHEKTLGATCQIERIYWAKKAIEKSLIRTGDNRKISVSLGGAARFKLINL